MTRTDDWRLTIHHWPRAAEAGVRPQHTEGFSLDNSPALYRAHEIEFSNPPSREELLAVVARTPWMHVWEESLLPLIAQNQWPMIDPAHKGASVDLMSNGITVGRLEVWRQHRFCNRGYSVPMFGTYPGSEIDRFLKRRVRDKAKHVQAREHVDAHRYLILERLASGHDLSPSQLLDEVQKVLVEGDFLQAKRSSIAGSLRDSTAELPECQLDS